MSVDLIANGLVTVAATGASATATTAETDVYAGVKTGLRRLAHRAAAEGTVDGDPDLATDEILANLEASPKTSHAAVTQRVVELAGADVRGNIVVVAEPTHRCCPAGHLEMPLDINTPGRQL
jgi:hypothetical protein